MLGKMPPCKYCNTDTKRRFTYGEASFYVCADCARCFHCGGVVEPGDEVFYALPYPLIEYDIGNLRKENPRVLLGKEDFGIVIHRWCAACLRCGQKKFPDETTAYIMPSRKIIIICKTCYENIEIT